MLDCPEPQQLSCEHKESWPEEKAETQKLVVLRASQWSGLGALMMPFCHPVFKILAKWGDMFT